MSEATRDWGDDSGVPLAARRLGITEFELFCAAYESWFAHAASQHRIEKHFVQYMFYGDVPFWVRHFTRSTVSALGVDPPRDKASSIDFLLAWLLACVAGLVAHNRPRRGNAQARLEA